MTQSSVGNEFVESMREALAIARGETEPSRVHHVPVTMALNVREVRRRTGLSRAAFVEKFALDARAVQDWEQGRRVPDRAARGYLTVIAKRPDAVIEALAS